MRETARWETRSHSNLVHARALSVVGGSGHYPSSKHIYQGQIYVYMCDPSTIVNYKITGRDSSRS